MSGIKASPQLAPTERSLIETRGPAVLPEQSAPEPNLWLLKVQAQVCHRGLVLTLCPVQTWALGVPAPMVPGDPALGRTSGFPAQVYGVGPGFVWAHGQVGDL